MQQFTINPTNTQVIDSQGRMAPEWYRFFANLQRLLGDNQMQALVDGQYLTYGESDLLTNQRVLAEGTGIGLAIGADEAVISLEDAAVDPGPYGSESKTTSFTVDQQGRLIVAEEYDLDTDNITEGASNLFFTEQRAREAVSEGTGVISGTYTPTTSSLTNLAAVSVHPCQYIRIGTVVTVSGQFDVDPTAAGLANFDFSLPVPTTFSNSWECAGTATCNSVAGQSAAILGASSSARMQWVAVDTAPRAMLFTFQYSILP